jgi:dTDP-4-amino-4,6-dideoxygalactose transaminase
MVGARPVFVDVDPATLGMDPALLEGALTPATRAIIAVHQLGFPCALSEIVPIAHRHDLPLIEDAACAIGSEILTAGIWRRIGRPHGVAACFSFHPRKVVTTGDGGMVTTADEALATRLRMLRQHGMAADSFAGKDSTRVSFESFQIPATNARMTDLQAAVARPQLARLDRILDARRGLAERYRNALAEHPLVEPWHEPAWSRGNFQSYPLRIRPDTRLSQLEIMQRLLDRGVASRRGVGNAHSEPAYAEVPWSCGPTPCSADAHRQGHCDRLRQSERLRDGIVMIPLFHGMTAAEHDHVIASLWALAK